MSSGSKVWFHQSITFSDSQMLLNLSTSLQSSATKLSSPTWAHLSQAFSLLPSDTSGNLRHTLHPETWMAACSLGIFVWVAASVSVAANTTGDAEDIALCWVVTIAWAACRKIMSGGRRSGWWGRSPPESWCTSADDHPCCCLVPPHTEPKDVRGSESPSDTPHWISHKTHMPLSTWQLLLLALASHGLNTHNTCTMLDFLKSLSSGFDYLLM